MKVRQVRSDKLKAKIKSRAHLFKDFGNHCLVSDHVKLADDKKAFKENEMMEARPKTEKPCIGEHIDAAHLKLSDVKTL